MNKLIYQSIGQVNSFSSICSISRKAPSIFYNNIKKITDIMPEVTEVMSHKCYDGFQKVFEHESKELGCKMKFSIYFPSVVEADPTIKLPVIYYLSGLTCTEMNMIEKSGIQRHAELYKLIVVGPDTSPRNCNVPGEDEAWDLGTGAGFYVDATQEPWKKNYRMQSYVTKELREVVARNFPCLDNSRAGITGHSMGGHGALVTYLRNPELYKAVTAFSPVTNPSKHPWGRRCLTAYLGTDENTWKEYDATELVKSRPQKDMTILIEQGDKDEWLAHQEHANFIEACSLVGQPLKRNLRKDYGHLYYFVSTFIGDHMKHFANILHKL